MPDSINRETHNNLFVKFFHEEILCTFSTEECPINLEGICPYVAKDEKFRKSVSTFFYKKKWNEISLIELESVFGSDSDAAFYFLGWNSLKYYIPLIMISALESYQDQSLSIYTFEKIVSDPSRLSLDNTSNFYKWISEFSPKQKSLIILLISYFQYDPLNNLVGDFSKSLELWI